MNVLYELFEFGMVVQNVGIDQGEAVGEVGDSNISPSQLQPFMARPIPLSLKVNT